MSKPKSVFTIPYRCIIGIFNWCTGTLNDQMPTHEAPVNPMTRGEQIEERDRHIEDLIENIDELSTTSRAFYAK